MIEILKQTEPRSLTEYKNTPGAKYDDMHSDLKNHIKLQLLKEQGYLCAYCMRRISLENSSIEHWTPRSQTDEKMKLQYFNMFAVCDGNAKKKGSERNHICDKKRGDNPLTVNPSDKTTLKEVKYTNRGIIKSDNETINKDLNETLNLNCESMYLVSNRHNALNAFLQMLEKKHGNKKIERLQYEKYYETYSGYDSDGFKTEYCGIILKWLEKKMR